MVPHTNKGVMTPVESRGVTSSNGRTGGVSKYRSSTRVSGEGWKRGPGVGPGVHRIVGDVVANGGKVGRTEWWRPGRGWNVDPRPYVSPDRRTVNSNPPVNKEPSL